MRLLLTSFRDDARDLAFDEATLRLTGSGEVRGPTLRLYRGRGALVLGARGGPSVEALRGIESSGLRVLRRPTSGDPYLLGSGWLSLTLTSPCSAGEPASEAAGRMCEMVQSLLQAVGVGVRLEGTLGSGYLKGKRVFIAGLGFYRDAAILQGALWVSGGPVDLPIPEDAASLSLVSERVYSEINLMGELERAARSMGWVRGDPEDEEVSLAETLLRRKYSNRAWIERGLEPLTLKDLLIEVYVANPPTSRCREFVKALASAIRGLEDRVEVRIWRRGMGRPLGVPLSGGLVKAAKESKIPAIVIGGELMFYGRTPSPREIREAVEQRLKRLSSNPATDQVRRAQG